MTTHAASWTDGQTPSRHWLAAVAHRAFTAEEVAAGPTGFATCALSTEPHVAHDARDFTRSTLGGWGMDPLLDDACVIISELLSNALRYGVGGRAGPVSGQHPFRLGLLRRGRAVLCAVSDPGSDVPVVKEPDYFAESGRGLHVIEILSDDWGWTTPGRDGKTVWAVVSSRR